MIGTLQDELAELADVMSTAGAHLTCRAVDAIARVLAAAGYEQTAVSLIINHAGPDENGEHGDVHQDDLHHHLYRPACTVREQGVSPELRRMAQDYLRALLSHEQQPMPRLALTRQPRRLALLTPDGDRLDLTLQLGPAGQAELDIASGQGRHAVRVDGDLVLGGEENEGY